MVDWQQKFGWLQTPPPSVDAPIAWNDSCNGTLCQDWKPANMIISDILWTNMSKWGWSAGIVDMHVKGCFVLSDYTFYCSLLGAILHVGVLWTERGRGVQTTNREVSLLLRQVCDLLTCPGIALLVHGTNGWKWLLNHWALHVYFSLARSEGGMGTRNTEKVSYLWINLINQHIYFVLFVGRSRSSCIKIFLQCRLEPTHPSLKLPMATIRYNALDRSSTSR